MHMWFTHKASLMASMRKALLILALLVVMLQMAITPAMAKPQQPGGGGQNPTPPATQQGSVGPPPANGVGIIADPVKDESKDNVGVVADPVRDESKGNVGIIADPVKNPGKDNVGIIADPVTDEGKGNVGVIADPVIDPGKDTADPSKTGNTLIHCSPDTDCSKEDASNHKAATASADAQGKGFGEEIHGCPYDYTYSNSAFDICGPADPEELIPEFFLSDDQDFTFGEFVDELGEIPTTLLSDFGFGVEVWGSMIEAGASTLGDYIGGDAGALVSGVGNIIGTSVEVGGALLDGLGHGAGAVLDEVGGAIDDVIDAADAVEDFFSGLW